MGHTSEQSPSRVFDEFRLPALAFEHEACDRYAEFETWFAERGRAELAALCASLAKCHRDLCLRFEEAGGAAATAAIDAARRSWIQQGEPQPRPVEFFYRVAGGRQLIEIAMAEETGAALRFEAMARESGEGLTHRLAAELGAKSRECAERLSAAIETAMPPDWEEMIASGGGPCLALGAERRLRPPVGKR